MGGQELIPEALLLIFPYLPPDDYGAVSRTSRRWRQISAVMFRQYLAWRGVGVPYHVQDSPPPLKTSYHLHGRDCYTLTREYMPLSGDAKIMLSRRSLQQVTDAGAANPPSGAQEVASELLVLHKVVFCHMYKALLLVLSTEVIEIHSLETGRFQTRLLPIPSQRRGGMKFTNIVSCHTTESGVTTVACKMRPGSCGGASQVNLYKILPSGKLMSCIMWDCSLKKVRSCKLTERYIVMKGLALEGDKEVPEVVALDVATGRRTHTRDPTLGQLRPQSGVRRDASLVGVDASVAFFLQQPSTPVTLPNAWCRWSDRLMRRKLTPTPSPTFELIQWNIATQKVASHELAVSGIPAPYGWPTNDSFGLLIDKDRCQMADYDSVFVCFFLRVPTGGKGTSPQEVALNSGVPAVRQAQKGVGIVCVYTKAGRLLSTLDASVPSIRKMAFGTSASEGFADANDEKEVSTEFLSTHSKSQVLLFSITVGSGDSACTKILAHEFHPQPAILPPGIV